MFSKKAPSKLSGPKPAAAKAATAPAPNPKKGFRLLPGFGKKKTGAAAPSKPPESAAAPASTPLKEAAPARSIQHAPKKAKGGAPIGLLLPIIALLILGGGGYYAFTRLGGAAANNAESPPAATEPIASIPQAPTESADALRVKPAPKKLVNCEGKPKFLNKLGFVGDITFSTNEKGIRGLILFGSTSENSDALLRYQHQSWSSAGFLDAFVMDRNGNLYLAPSPRTGLGVSQPKNQDHIFKLDTQNGALASYVTLPSAAPASSENPYGVLGLAYDCDTNSLYATSVMGSTPAQPAGRIYRIDLDSGEIADQRDNLDAYGIAIRAASSKELIFGSPEDVQIRALDLDQDGNFQGEPRTIATLADPLRARKISLANENEMVVQAVEFSFTNAEIPQETETRFQYDAASGVWTPE